MSDYKRAMMAAMDAFLIAMPGARMVTMSTEGVGWMDADGTTFNVQWPEDLFRCSCRQRHDRIRWSERYRWERPQESAKGQ